ncbi:unnamed protein product [Cunninghamella echinulata]
MSDSEDDIPLSLRTQSNVISTNDSNSATSSQAEIKSSTNIDSGDEEDDIPLAQRHKSKRRQSDSDDDIPLSQRTPHGNKRTIKEESSDEHDVPLSQRKQQPVKKRIIKKEQSSDDEDDIPLAKKQKLKAVKTVKPAVKKEDIKPLKRSISTKTETKVSNKKVKKEVKEEDENIYKWWEESKQSNSGENGNNEDGGIKWVELIHNGVLFPLSMFLMV